MGGVIERVEPGFPKASALAIRGDSIAAEEALVMMTREAAYAINRDREVGTLWRSAAGRLPLP